MTTQVTIKLDHKPHGPVKIIRRERSVETPLAELVAEGETHTNHIWEGSDIVIRETPVAT